VTQVSRPFLGALCLLAAACSAGRVTPVVDEDRAVLEALLAAVASDSLCRPLYLMDSTITPRTTSPSGWRAWHDSWVPPSIDSQLARLREASDARRPLPAGLQAPVGVDLRLVSEEPIDSAAGRPWAPACWTAHVSAIAYSSDHTTAILYLTLRCNDSGHGELVQLGREADGRWRTRWWYNMWAAG